jgi:hypothetical protein
MMRLSYREPKWSGRSLRSDVATAYPLFGSGSDAEQLAMSTTGPLNPEQLTRGKTLDEFCVGPFPDQMHRDN